MRILIIANTYIGDVTLSTGVINYFLKKYPNAKFTIAAGPSTTFLFEDFPNLEKIIPVKKKSYSRHWFELWKKCFSTKWDIIIDFKHSPICLFLRAKKKICKQKKIRTAETKIEQNSRFADINSTCKPSLWFHKDRTLKARTLLNSHNKKKLIALAPTTNWLPKMWPIENFVELAKQLLAQKEFSDAVFLILAAPHELRFCKPLFDAIPPSHLLDLTIDLPLLTKVACIKQSNLFIGNDSGLLHIASACDIPVIGLFGPTTTTAYYPQGEKAIVIKAPLTENDMPAVDQTVMRRISINEVLKKTICGVNKKLKG
ncbi:MAG: glycosyltransferase family 9 protein [Coxiellaceae bacterium]|nr:glycosyltransferase family 9 protein [Coxiellaceae bacterium]